MGYNRAREMIALVGHDLALHDHMHYNLLPSPYVPAGPNQRALTADDFIEPANQAVAAIIDEDPERLIQVRPPFTYVLGNDTYQNDGIREAAMVIDVFRLQAFVDAAVADREGFEDFGDDDDEADDAESLDSPPY